MYIHLQAQAVFLCHPRTASRATSHLLKSLGFLALGAVDLKTVPLHRAGTCNDHHERLAGRPPAPWSVACTVRDHMEVVASWLCALHLKKAAEGPRLDELRKRQVGFWPEQFLDSLHNSSRMGALYYPKRNSLLPNTETSTRLLFYDTLQHDLSSWLLDIGVIDKPEIELRSEGAQTRQGLPADVLMTDTMRAAVIDRYGDEMRDWKFLN